MARRVEQPARNQDGAEDLAILHPDRQVTIAGVDLVVREYRFAESLRIRPLTQVIVDGLYQAFRRNDSLTAEQVLDVLADQHEALVQLVALACDRDRAWVEGLTAQEGEYLTFTWWVVNRDFFVTRATNRIAEDRRAEAAAPDGPTSTTASPSDTADPNNSADTRGAS